MRTDALSLPRSPLGLVVGLCLLLSVLAPATASAGVPSRSERRDALRFAKDYWAEHGRSLADSYCYGKAYLRVGHRGRNVLGWVESAHPCTLWLNTNTEWSDGGLTDSWWRVCATAIHEYGHLVGRGHSRDPDSIMAATSELNEWSSWWPYFPGCRYDGDDADDDGFPDW
jgi:hypothetical protein